MIWHTTQTSSVTHLFLLLYIPLIGNVFCSSSNAIFLSPQSGTLHTMLLLSESLLCTPNPFVIPSPNGTELEETQSKNITFGRLVYTISNKSLN